MTETKINKNKLDSTKTQVAILVYPCVELLDFSGPAEVFGNARGFQVFTVATEEGAISTKNNTLSMNPDYVMDDAPQPDILVVPGAPTDLVLTLSRKQEIIDYIQKTTYNSQLTMSVCTGALLLSKSGLLDGRTATTHLSVIDTLQALTPKARIVDTGRFVQDGKIMTTAGVSAGIDGALHVVEQFQDKKAALLVTAIMQYEAWDASNGLMIDPAPVTMKTLKMDMYMDHMMDTQGDVKDVVCGMNVGSDSKYSTKFEDTTYHFCSGSCQTLFERHPDLYVDGK